LLGSYASGGTTPKSLAVYKNFVYVLNGGGAGNITGFTLDESTGTLTPIAESTQPLSGNSDPQPFEIGFFGNGYALAVTESATQLLDVFPVNAGGAAGPPAFQSMPFPNPSGFVCDSKGRIYIAEAEYASSFSGQVTSFQIGARRGLTLLTGGASTIQGGTAYLAMNPAQTLLWASDVTSDALSPLTIDSEGFVTVGFSNTVGTPSSPYDIARSGDSQNVYVLYLSPAQVITYTVNGEELVQGTSVSVSSTVAAGLVVQ
jgi:6-phosphogluconolactonase (cycloisomerase 2 family)